MEAEVEIFQKVKRLVRKPIGAQKRLFFWVSSFLPYASQILETQELFPRTYFTHQTSYAHLSLFMVYWNIQENLDSQELHFKNCIFWLGGVTFELIKNLATLVPEKL